MNVAVRMQPSMQYTYNARSFFIEDEQDQRRGDLNNGLWLWQGYFQSIRPARNGMLINIDIATGVVFQGGPLIDLCLKHLNKRPHDARALTPGSSLQERDRLRLQRFTHGLRITTGPGHASANNTARTLRKFSSHGASSLQFTHGGKTKSVAEYYREILGRPLKYPDIVCVEVRDPSHPWSSTLNPTGRQWSIDSFGVVRRYQRPARQATSPC